MNTMQIVSELADSGILAVGSRLTEIWFAPAFQGQDDDAHVAAYDALCFCDVCLPPREADYTASDRRRDEHALASWQRAVAEGTMPDGYGSLEDFGYVGPRG